MKHIIVGTAGHIDHGKTALVQALTGTNPDRLKEEQERGITIDIGFARLALANDVELGIIDVPGHERFVKNMLAGVGGIDVALLVVAADEGVMPQTREHVAICDLLRIRQSVVALTKCDLVDDEWREMVTEDLREELAGTVFAGATIIPVSAKTRVGLDRLVAELERLSAHLQERPTEGIIRLPVDRVFTIKGFGTVITGTLISGVIQREDIVEILPHQTTSRVRNIQVHDMDVPQASAGQRTALNLHGIEKHALKRGDVIAEPGLLTPTYMLDAFLTLLPKASRPLKNRSRVRFHQGTDEILARVVLLDREELLPGDSTYAQFRLEAPAIVMAQDRYIIRSYSPVITIGGGEIVYAHPKKHKASELILSQLQTLREGSPDDVLAYYVEQAGYEPITPRQMAGMVAISVQEISASLRRLIAQKRIITTDPHTLAVLHATHYRALRARVLHTLDAFHESFPLKPGMSKEELRKQLPPELPPQVFQLLLDAHITTGELAAEQDLIRKASHHVALSGAQQRLKEQIEQIYRRQRFEPPSKQEALQTTGENSKASEAIFRVLVTEGILVRVEEDLYYHRAILDEITQRVVAYLGQQHEMKVGDLKTLCGVSRKYAVPLLTYLDAASVTLRKGDVRILRAKVP